MPRHKEIKIVDLIDRFGKDRILKALTKRRFTNKKKVEERKTGQKHMGFKRGGMKDPSKAIRSVKPTLGRKKTEEFLRKLKDKKKKMGGGMLKYKKGGFPDLSGDGKTTMKDVLIGRGVIKKKSGGSVNKKKKPIRRVSFEAMLEAVREKNRNPMKDQRLDDSIKGKEVRFKKSKGGRIDKNVRVIDLQKQGKTSKKGIRVKGKGKSFMDVYKKTVYNRADGGMVPFGGEKRVPGSGAATRGTGFKGIF